MLGGRDLTTEVLHHDFLYPVDFDYLVEICAPLDNIELRGQSGLWLCETLIVEPVLAYHADNIITYK
ncbi:hypothetical protein O9K51_08198 [Purpureocillium lavendulum]|uniref:Uncharacterized protein n=1 Tax=Purpureocillium lavendulum TaxID=1247861 RepID=A0AB34FK13_9HYPO|nr:hypothetical protein O9K51_08198 [Purpureocillium lavendulum]